MYNNKESNYKWREKNPEKYKEVQRRATKKYRENHKKEMNKNQLNYYYRHRQEILKKLQEKRDKNKEGKNNDIL